MKIQLVRPAWLWAIAASTAAIATASQPASAAIVNGSSEYFLTSTKTSWQDAQAAALSLGGHLVAINDADEQQFLFNNFPQYNGIELIQYWIGLTDSANEGTFSWVNGDPLVYTNWNLNTGDPNNVGNGENEDHVLMNWQAEGKWADFPSPGSSSQPQNYYGIVERSVPTPALLPGLLAFGAGIVRKRKSAAV